MSHCRDKRRHCEGGKEKNVFSRTDENSVSGSPGSLGNSPSLTEQEPVRPPACDIQDGKYGHGSQSVQVTYLYQVQTTLELRVETLDETVLRQVEAEVTELVASDLTGCTISSSDQWAQQLARSFHRALQEEHSNGGLTGLDSAPPDEVRPGLEGVQCQTRLVPGARRCFVVGGVFNIQGDEGWNPEVASQAALVSTKTVLDQGLRRDLHPGVLDVAFLSHLAGNEPKENGQPVETAPNQQRGEITSNKNDGRTQAWPWVITSMGLLTILAVFVLVGRRRRRQDEEYQEPPFTGLVVESERMVAPPLSPYEDSRSGVGSGRYTTGSSEHRQAPFTPDTDSSDDVAFPQVV